MKNKHAVALGRLGGRRGGFARAGRLASRERTFIARKAAFSRWQGVTDEWLAGRAGRGRQSRLPKFLYSAFRRDDPTRIRLPLDMDCVIASILVNGTPEQRVWLLRRFGREEIVFCVRRWRGGFFKTKEQLLEWVSPSTAWRWLRQRTERAEITSKRLRNRFRNGPPLPKIVTHDLRE